MKDEVGPAELRDVNITVLDAADAQYDRLAATCDTVPFLAEKRMVILEGLVSQFEPRPASRAGGRAAVAREPGLGRWEALPEYLPRVPQTTDLVFVDGRLTQANPLFGRLRPLVEVRTFPLPSGNELRQWVRQRASKLGMDIEPAAVNALAETIGGDLRAIDSELQKLSLYRSGQQVRRQDVEELVAYVKEANIFAAVDSVLEGRTAAAMRWMHQLIDAGRPVSYLLVMLGRQVRLLLLAKDLRAQGVPAAQIGRRLSLSSYPLRKTIEQEGRFTEERLVEMHRKLLEADISVKTGGTDEQLALDMLIADLASGR